MKSSTMPFVCGDILNPDYNEAPTTATRSPLEMLVLACNSIGREAAAESVSMFEGKRITMSNIIKPKARAAVKGFSCQLSPESHVPHDKTTLHSMSDESPNPLNGLESMAALHRSRSGSPLPKAQPFFVPAPESLPIPLATPLHRLAVEDGQFNQAAYQLWLDFLVSARSKTNGLSNNNHPFYALNAGCPPPVAPSQQTANHVWCNPDYFQHSSSPQSVLNALTLGNTTPAVLSYLTAMTRAQQSKSQATTTESDSAAPCQPYSACQSCTPYSLQPTCKPTSAKREHSESVAAPKNRIASVTDSRATCSARPGQPHANDHLMVFGQRIQGQDERKNTRHTAKRTSKKHADDYADAAVPKSMRLSSGLRAVRDTQSKCCTSPSTSGDSLK